MKSLKNALQKVQRAKNQVVPSIANRWKTRRRNSSNLDRHSVAYRRTSRWLSTLVLKCKYNLDILQRSVRKLTLGGRYFVGDDVRASKESSKLFLRSVWIVREELEEIHGYGRGVCRTDSRTGRDCRGVGRCLWEGEGERIE